MLKALEIAGIVIASLILLIVILFLALIFLPVGYSLGGSNKETLYAYFNVSLFLSLFRLKVYYRDKMGYVACRIIGIKVLDKSIPDTVELAEKLIDKISKLSNKSDSSSKEEDSTKISEESAENVEEETDLSVEEAEEFLNEHDEIEDMGPVKKRISFLRWIKDIVLNIKKKWYNFKDYINKKLNDWNKFKKYCKFYWRVLQCPSLKPTLVLLKNIGIDFLKRTFPKKWRMKIIFGDEDPYINAKVYGYVCAAKGLFNKNIDFTPVFGERVLKIDGYVWGYVQPYIMLKAGFQIFANKHVRRMIKLIRKGGNISGRN